MSHSYFVVMLDYGGTRGLEATVHPEDTRRDIVDRLVTGEDDPDRVVFIHYVAGFTIEDVTEDIMLDVGDGIQDRAERDYERQCARYYGGDIDSLREKQIEGWRLK